MAESLNFNKIVCPICSDPLGDKCHAFVNCGHVICQVCNDSLELATNDPWTDAEDDFWGIPLQVNYLSGSKCVICRTEGRRQRLFLTEDVDEEKKDLEKKVKELEKALYMQKLEERMEKKERTLFQSRITERSLELDDRPEVVTREELVGAEDRSSFYCVRCGNLGHLSSEKVCITPAEGKAIKKQILGPEKHQKWTQNKWETNRRRFESRWNNGKFVPRYFFEMHHAGVAVQVDNRDWVKKI